MILLFFSIIPETLLIIYYICIKNKVCLFTIKNNVLIGIVTALSLIIQVYFKTWLYDKGIAIPYAQILGMIMIFVLFKLVHKTGWRTLWHTVQAFLWLLAFEMIFFAIIFLLLNVSETNNMVLLFLPGRVVQFITLGLYYRRKENIKC